MSPVFTSLGVWLLCNQRFDRRFLAGMALAILGAIALEGNNLLVDRHRAMGDLAALLAALLYAANLLTIESLRSKLRLLPSWGCGHAFVGEDPPFGCPSASAQGPRSGTTQTPPSVTRQSLVTRGGQQTPPFLRGVWGDPATGRGP